MTIVACVKVRDGIVLAADSMTTIPGTTAQGDAVVMQTYSNARKLFQIGTHPIGVLTYGLGAIGTRSIEGLMVEFSKTQREPRSVEAVAGDLFEFVSSRYAQLFPPVQGDRRPMLGFVVGGYSPDAEAPDNWDFMLPYSEGIREVYPRESIGFIWNGVTLPMHRLVNGYDPQIIPRLQNKGLDDNGIREVLGGLGAPLVFDGMPVQDAVNLAVFILETTIRLEEFQPGIPACGGRLQVATILPGRGFEWLQEPTLVAQSR